MFTTFPRILLTYFIKKKFSEFYLRRFRLLKIQDEYFKNTVVKFLKVDTRTHDTSRSFEPIFMKFAWLP